MKISAHALLKTVLLTLQNGKSISAALGVLAAAASTRQERIAFERMVASLKEGERFSGVLERHGMLPKDVAAFVAAAEEGGRLRSALEGIVHYLEVKETFKQESSDKISLPVVYFSLASLIVMFVRFFAVPAQIEESLKYDAKIQFFIANHLAIAQLLGDILFAFLMGAAGYFAVMIFALFSESRGMQYTAKSFASLMPLTARVVEKFEKFMLMRLLGEMLKNGVPFKKALAAAAGATEVRRFKKGFAQIAEQARMGNRNFLQSPLFDEVEQHLLTGVGSMEQMGGVLLQVSAKARSEAIALSNRFFRLITVVSIFLMAFAVLVEFFTVVLTQVLIQRGMINAVEVGGGAL